jgi:cold shock CspA family protein
VTEDSESYRGSNYNRDTFFHWRDVDGIDRADLQSGMRVEYDLIKDQKDSNRVRAVNVRLAEIGWWST